MFLVAAWLEVMASPPTDTSTSQVFQQARKLNNLPSRPGSRRPGPTLAGAGRPHLRRRRPLRRTSLRADRSNAYRRSAGPNREPRRARGLPGRPVRPSHRGVRVAAASGAGRSLSRAAGRVVLQPGVEPGSLAYTTRGGERLAGFAPVPATGWGVVVERSSAAALASGQAGRNRYLLLLGAIGGAALLGVVAAVCVTAPIGDLAAAARRFGAGDATVPLPRSGVTELATLSREFDQMRDSLAVRAGQLRVSEHRYRSLVAATTAIVWTVDAKGRFVEPQHSWQTYTGQVPNEHRRWLGRGVSP